MLVVVYMEKAKPSWRQLERQAMVRADSRALFKAGSRIATSSVSASPALAGMVQAWAVAEVW